MRKSKVPGGQTNARGGGPREVVEMEQIIADFGL